MPLADKSAGPDISRRAVLTAAAAAAIALPVADFASQAKSPPRNSTPSPGENEMTSVTTKDGVQIYYKDWGTGQPIVFSHGWPLSADDWDSQMIFFLNRGFRVVAHDRRGHGRSTQSGTGHDMDHYADDLAAVIAHLDLKNAVHIGHSTGGGEAVRYLARHGESRVAKAVLLSAVPPIMVKTPANPGGLAKDVFDGLQAKVANNRAQLVKNSTLKTYKGIPPWNAHDEQRDH